MPPKLAVVGMSGRALARSAVKSGERVVVLDAFGDRDSRSIAEVVCIAADDRLAIDAERLRAALAGEAREAALGIVIGSGLEHAPELAASLAAYGRLYANDAGLIAALKDPELGPALLRATGWSVPTTQRAAPIDRRGWLQKEAGGAGGEHIRRAGRAPAGPRTYFQRETGGAPRSVTVLADGERAHLIGFNRLLVAAVGAAPYCYAGAIADVELPPASRAQAQSRLDRLVRVTGLRGLAGVDFLLDGDAMIALEVNPRPTASFELYDDDFAEGLVHWHRLSFERPVPEFGERLGRRARAHRALGVVYADRPLRIGADAAFPAWCRDLPRAGRAIPAGAPVLSVCATGADSGAAARAVEARARAVRALLARWAVADWRAVA